MSLTIDAVTDRLGLGPHPDGADHARSLIDAGYRCVANVGNGPSATYSGYPGFRAIVQVPIEDLAPIPVPIATCLLGQIHGLLMSFPDERLYIHCIAGQNRSPTILWLYLLSLGVSPAEATARISDARMDAVPGHEALIHPALIDAATNYRHTEADPAHIAAILQPPT